MAQVDLEDNWDPLDDLVVLHTADDAGELHRRLLCFPSGGGNECCCTRPEPAPTPVMVANNHARASL